MIGMRRLSLNRFSVCVVLALLAAGGCSALRRTETTRAPDSYAAYRATEAHHVPGEGFLFVFATIADSHIEITADDDSSFIEALGISRSLLATYVTDINAHSPSVDFAVHLGDLTHQGRRDQFEAAGRILGTLDCPLYPVLGNHDNMQSDNKRGWKAFAGRDHTDYSFDHLGYHFVVIDCTLDPYKPPRVDCDRRVRRWVARDLSAHHGEPSIILTHYNMWERGWNARFDTTGRYGEYRGIPKLRRVLEQAGNVMAVINGHVHANRLEVHNGIYYVDVGATLVGAPSIRYFYAYPDSIVVDYEYISNETLFNRVVNLGRNCRECFNPAEVVEFIDGSDSDKRFTIRGKSSAVERNGS